MKLKKDLTTVYIALDLELNNAPDHSTPDPNIIQVGIAIGEPWAINTYSWYVNPHEPIYPNITQLTGITDYHVEHESVPLDVVAKELGEIIQQYKPFVNPVTWGRGDMDALIGAFYRNGCYFPHFGRRYVDVKTLYSIHMLAKNKRPNGGLRSAMGEFKMQFVGTPHRADVDAKNTLYLFFEILERQRKVNEIIQLAKEAQ